MSREILTTDELVAEAESWDNDNSEKIPLGGLIRRLVLTACKYSDENICDACLGDPSSVLDGNCMCRGTGKMSEAAIYLREQLTKAQFDLGNLLAVIHRDGGHYAEKHGRAQTVAGAMNVVCSLRDRLTEAHTEIDNLRVKVAEVELRLSDYREALHKQTDRLLEKR